MRSSVQTNRHIVCGEDTFWIILLQCQFPMLRAPQMSKSERILYVFF